MCIRDSEPTDYEPLPKTFFEATRETPALTFRAIDPTTPVATTEFTNSPNPSTQAIAPAQANVGPRQNQESPPGTDEDVSNPLHPYFEEWRKWSLRCNRPSTSKKTRKRKRRRRSSNTHEDPKT